ncbi:UDP-N-acetylglucosamine 2-epimerase (non-hydrolyzing) [Ectothiorhodospira haloalkaliphila]|uniref:non-hydrolyzing UDP-N-acetylglucosamine 2-epimerase n=1 Tax=Ectothiorhodospira haloalkaliphila TaxID=421628 RepID=UPI001EE9A835|nr:UDP-N-acetylglucosamine 2-epimerase (non-hydrolyzing) [Ectothiorhodospira haloalkaliphila]MCG5524329.1 UDP-N-acetylglucosamine 2-epimerase (non-hydrolyzing) [Ectothiorhodospira haloalkaliphila]
MIKQESTSPILCIVGARPNFMKIAPIMRAFAAERLPAMLLHTGQHYDRDMNDTFFNDLGIPKPDFNLGVGSGSHTQQTAQIMLRVEPILNQLNPSAVLVVGDVNSTIACALVSVKQGIPIIHVESGLRSNDRTMPEEINRILTDQLSDLLFTTEPAALSNLQREGISPERVHLAGNVMIDTLHFNLPRAIPYRTTIEHLGIADSLPTLTEGYALLTLHRPSNVDNLETLESIVSTINQLALQLPFIFPMHPRTRDRLERFNLLGKLDNKRIITTPPQGYLQLLGLMKDSRIVLTDSGGIQEETTALGIPCLTLRENTERPITIHQGTNTLVGRNPELILRAFHQGLEPNPKRSEPPKHWDGKAAIRIAATVKAWLASLPQNNHNAPS